MLAQVLLPGLAKESVISNSNVSIGAIAFSQNAEMPVVAVVAGAVLVEHRRADRVLEHAVLGVDGQPLGEVALGHRGVGALRGGPGRVVVVRGVPGDGVGGDGRGAHGRHRRAKLEHVLVRVAGARLADVRRPCRVHRPVPAPRPRWRHGQAEVVPARRAAAHRRSAARPLPWSSTATRSRRSGSGCPRVRRTRRSAPRWSCAASTAPGVCAARTSRAPGAAICRRALKHRDTASSATSCSPAPRGTRSRCWSTAWPDPGARGRAGRGARRPGRPLPRRARPRGRPGPLGDGRRSCPTGCTWWWPTPPTPRRLVAGPGLAGRVRRRPARRCRTRAPSSPPRTPPACG